MWQTQFIRSLESFECHWPSLGVAAGLTGLADEWSREIG